MKYVFLDIEWEPGSEAKTLGEKRILEVGAWYYNSDDKREGFFFQYVKPKKIKDVNPAMLCNLHINASNLHQAKCIRNVLKDLLVFIKNVDILITWSEKEMKEIHDLLPYYHYKKPRCNYTVLQELFRLYPMSEERCADFRTCLIKANISYNERKIQNALFNAKYLKELYLKARRYLSCTEEYKAGKVFLQHRRTGKIHESHCSSIANSNEMELLPIKPRVVMNNEAVCKHCKKYIEQNIEDGFREIKQREAPEEFTKNNIKKYCKKFGFTYRKAGENILISSRCSAWLLQHNSEYVTYVLHSNYNLKNGIRKKGFHFQKIKGRKTLKGIMVYINNHDKYMTLKYKENALILQNA